ncbi:MAG: exosortase-associated EpsI family protein [Verrucomicrobia bacterium]|nr:exosortase-associated EpsI family protein [Verrucomicrobiota bacterium]
MAKVVNDWLPKDTVYGQRYYEAPDGYWLQSTVVLMGTDRTSIHKPEYCLTGQGFQVSSIERDTVEISQPHRYELPVVKMTLSREATSQDGQRIKQSALFVYWFVADDQLTADHNERMLWMARDQVTRGLLQRWAYVSCFTVFHPGQERAVYSRMRDWISASVPEFQIATRPSGALARLPE